MKKTLVRNLSRLIFGVLSIILITAAVPASAQSKKMNGTMSTPEARAEKYVAYWNKHLQLSADQQGQFKTFLTDEITKQDSLRSAVKDSKSRNAGTAEIRKETHAKMEAILTPDQHRKFLAMESTHGKRKTGVKKAKKSTQSMNTKPSKTPPDTTNNN